MSRLISTDGVGKQRDRMMKALALSLRELAKRPKIDDETRDLAAFLVLALRQIHATIDVTCAAWEKRDYWVKSDQFRRDWMWAEQLAGKLEAVVLGERWSELAGLMPALAGRVAKVVLPKRNTLGSPWLGAYAQLREEHGLEQARVVK